MNNRPVNVGRVTVWAIGVFVLSVVILFALIGAYKSFHRYQQRADAGNRVKVTNINIRAAQQQVRVQRQLANVKAAEADGIRRAQDIINRTLTPLYVQHEAIQAQERIATSGKNNTVIYVPATTNGTPVITQAGDVPQKGANP